MNDRREYDPLGIANRVAIRIAGYLLLDECRWDDMYGYDRMPDSDLLDDLPKKMRPVVKAVKRILEKNDPEGNRIRHHAFANEIHRALENAIDTFSDVVNSSGYMKDLMREHAVARSLIRRITNGKKFLTEFDKTLELDEDALTSIDDYARDSYLEKVNRARQMVDSLLTTHEFSLIRGHISDDHRDIEEIVNTIRKYGAHAGCSTMRGLPITDSMIFDIMSYRKEMIDAFRRSGASQKEVAKFEDLMGSDEKIVEMGVCARRLEADGVDDWLKAFDQHIRVIHVDAVNYAVDVLCS